MILGLDLDNTLVCYDEVFHAAALELGLIPESVPPGKTSVRDYLRAAGREEEWTKLQGHIYGPGMERARPFPGVLDFLRRCRESGARVVIVSHRTPRPFLGPAHDLHACARQWLEREGFFAPATGLRPEDVFLEATKQDKLSRIASERCEQFVDDLVEFLDEPGFPETARRWLFAPAGSHAKGKYPSIASWEQAASLLLAPAGTAGLLRQAGVSSESPLSPLPGAANNRVFLIEDKGRRLVLKQYFRHEQDQRDRLSAEFGFARFAWEAGARQLPQPLACDAENGLALFSFVEGRKLLPGEADIDAVSQALAFLRGVNGRRDQAAGLSDASEACFSLAEHFGVVAKRLQRLTTISGEPRQFVAELQRAWRDIEAGARRSCAERGLDLERVLLPEERVVSPSDFGFHNAILGPDGRLAFLDFEYAGWDDPAKLVCDFFCQQAVPAPHSEFERFARGVAALGAGAEAAMARVAVLRPVYGLKWCCILLNEFLPAGQARRRFAQAAGGSSGAQLDKARRLLSAVCAEAA